MHQKETVCEYCGYDLRGHEGDWRQCPECGEWNDFTARESLHRPLTSKWSNFAVGFATAILVSMLVFFIVLNQNGLRLMDLWGLSDARLAMMRTQASGGTVVSQEAIRFAAIGLMVSNVCFFLAFAACIYSICVIVAAFGRRDRRTKWVASLGMLLSVLAGFLAVHVGFVVIGM